MMVTIWTVASQELGSMPSPAALTQQTSTYVHCMVLGMSDTAGAEYDGEDVREGGSVS